VTGALAVFFTAVFFAAFFTGAAFAVDFFAAVLLATAGVSFFAAAFSLPVSCGTDAWRVVRIRHLDRIHCHAGEHENDLSSPRRYR
jgi:hypothetical protein